ncbi:hypothetical protein K438DRAFT_1754484 [Mycena galopus ATCC 62051]|nr:hypothetical protein K438DRAFT_1754484 [Mycena galopus ATCC 62051]
MACGQEEKYILTTALNQHRSRLFINILGVTWKSNRFFIPGELYMDPKVHFTIRLHHRFFVDVLQILGPPAVAHSKLAILLLGPINCANVYTHLRIREWRQNGREQWEWHRLYLYIASSAERAALPSADNLKEPESAMAADGRGSKLLVLQTFRPLRFLYNIQALAIQAEQRAIT